MTKNNFVIKDSNKKLGFEPQIGKNTSKKISKNLRKNLEMTKK